MSATRVIIRLFLVVVLIGLVGLVFVAWRNSDPNLAVTRAETDVKNEQFEAAKLRLQSHLQKKPENAAAHQLLASVMLKEAEQKGEKGETYFSNPEAFTHLITAANLKPEDLELQKEVLSVFLRGNKPREGVPFAERILETEPENADALYADAVSLVGNNNKKAPAKIEKLLKIGGNRTFQTYALALAYYERNKKEAEIQKTFDEAVAAAAALTAEQVNTMPRPESDAMSRMLKASVSRAPDASVALARAKVALDTLDKFPLDVPAVLSDVTQIDSELLLGLREQFKPTADSAEQKSLRDALQARVDDLRDRSLAANVASPLVFQQSAAAAFAAGNHEECAKILKQGLAEAAAKPPARQEDVLELHLLAARNYVVMRKHEEAQQHIAALEASKNDTYAGWGALLSGGIATAEGRYEKAYRDFQDAQKKLGANLFVNMGLANTCLSLGKWQEALPHLKALHRSFDSADVELKAWAAQNNISSANVNFGEFRAYLALDDWKSAQDRLAALTGTPLAAQAQAMAIMYLWGKADRQEAMTRLAAARAQAPDNLMLLQMEAAFKQAAGDGASAGKILEDAAKANPGDLQRQLLFARWQIQQKKLDDALAFLTKLAADFPQETAPKLLQAQVHLMKGEIAESTAIATQLQDVPDAKAAASFLLAAADMREKDPEAAAKELAAMAEAMPNNGLINLLQSEVSTAQGDYAGAIDDLSGSLDVLPIRAQARTMLLRSLLLLAAEKGPAAAEAKLQPIVDENPKDEFLKIALADLKFKQGQFDTAMKLLDEAERLDPGRGNVPYIKASIWLQRGRVATAYGECERALSIQPDHVPARLMAANLALAQGKFKDALEHAAVVLKQAPKYAPMILTESAAMVGLGRKTEAQQMLQKSIADNPKVDVYYDRLMSLEFDAGQKDQALATIRQGRKEAPDSLLLAGDEIALLVNLEKADEAQEVARAFTNNQMEPARFLAVAQAFFRGRKFDEARDWGGQALALAKDEVKPAVHLFLGDVNLVQFETSPDKDKEILAKARDHFAAVIAAQPKNFVAGNNLAWILATEFNEPERAAEVIDEVRGKATVEQMPVNFIDTVAVVYRKANRLEDAQQVLERANAMYQENPLLLYQLAVVQHDRKLYTAARTNLERALQLGVPEKYKAEAERLLSDVKTQTSDGTPTSTTVEKP
jgi:predicted Zn-dependent protease